METEHRKFNPHFIHLSSISSIFAGSLLLIALLYCAIVLRNAGFEVMVEQSAKELLGWISNNEIYWTILWSHFFLASVLFLPLPAAMSKCYSQRRGNSSALSTFGFSLGFGGAILLIISTLIYFASILIIARYTNQLETIDVFLYQIFASVALYLRLAGYLLISLLFVFVTVILLKKDKINSLAWAVGAMVLFTLIVVVGIVLNQFNWESYFVLLQGFILVWIGLDMRRISKKHKKRPAV